MHQPPPWRTRVVANDQPKNSTKPNFFICVLQVFVWACWRPLRKEKSWASSILNHADEDELQWDEGHGHHAVGTPFTVGCSIAMRSSWSPMRPMELYELAPTKKNYPHLGFILTPLAFRFYAGSLKASDDHDTSAWIPNRVFWQS